LVLAAFCTFLSCKGCRSRNTTPPAPVTEIISVDLPVSTFNLPLQYSIQNFEAFINKKISGRFLQTELDPFQDGKERITINFSKNGAIRIQANDQKLICFFPLAAEGILLESRLGKNITRAVKPLNTSVNITLQTNVALDADWALVTNFKVTGFSWVKEPVLQVGFLKKNLKSLLSEWLQKNQQQLTHLLNQEINKSVSLKEPVAKIWNDLQQPLLIHKKAPLTWLKFNCHNISANIKLQDHKVYCYTTVKAKALIMTDTTKQLGAAPLPAFKKNSHQKDSSDVYVYAFMPFEEINSQLNQLLAGKSFKAKDYTVAIVSVKAYASDAGLSVTVNTGKDVTGDLTVSGRLQFNDSSRQLTIQNFDYTVNTNSTLLNAGDDFLHDMIKDTISNKLTLQLDTLIASVPRLVENAIAKGKTGQAIDLTIEDLDIKHCDISMGAKSIHFKIHAGIAAGIVLKHINAGKKLKIKANKKR
jgi:hypothetical protein